MNRAEEMEQVCLDVLSKNGVNEDDRVTCSENITTELLKKGYVRYDSIGLDPQKCVQLLATILNGFKAEHPFVVIETSEEEKEEVVDEDK